MTVKIFDKFIPNVGITGWVCSECKTLARSSFQRLKQSIAHLAEELADVKQQLCRDERIKQTTGRLVSYQPTLLHLQELMASLKQLQLTMKPT
jgi:hypothetical protein